MSELKAYKGDIYIPVYGSIADAKVYLKSEADKVIAEKDAEIVELKKQVHDYAQGLYVIQARADKDARHHKYKRCLAMARWCRESLRLMRTYEVTVDYWNLEPGHDAEYFCKKGDFYSKWRKRWLELAEKFKEGV
jgi:hypothetical protein